MQNWPRIPIRREQHPAQEPQLDAPPAGGRAIDWSQTIANVVGAVVPMLGAALVSIVVVWFSYSAQVNASTAQLDRHERSIAELQQRERDRAVREAETVARMEDLVRRIDELVKRLERMEDRPGR